MKILEPICDKTYIHIFEGETAFGSASCCEIILPSSFPPQLFKFLLNMEFGVNILIPMIDGIKLSDIKFENIITCRSNIPYEFNQYDIIEYKNLKLVMIYDKCRDILRDKLLKLYSEYQPDKLPVVDTVIDEWEMSKLSGDNLLEILNQRYCNKKSENDNKSIEKSISVIEENDKEESSVTLDTISLSPIKLLVHQPNTEDSQSQQQQSQSQSQPLLLSQQEISLNSPLIIGNPEKENNLFYNKNEIINTNTKLRKKLDENMRGIDTPILNKNTYIEEENNIVKNTSISDEEKMENKKEEVEILNNSSKSTIDDISDIVTFVNIKNTNTNNNNEKSPELNSFNKQMTNFSTPSPINITNTTTSDTSNISTPIILLNGQISDNNNNNNRIYNESFSSLTTPSPIKTNISLIKSFDSSAATTPIPIMKCNNKMEEGEKENNTDIKETEIIKREPIERMLEMSNEDEIINNTVDECIIQNENKENESYCNSDIIVNMNIFKNKDIKKENNDNVKEEEESKQKENEKVDKIEMEEEDEERDEKENVEKVINEEYKQNEKNKIDEETAENEVKVENENDENKNLTPQYEVTVRKTRGMLKREEEEERRRKEVEESKEVTTTRKTIQSKCRNNKRKTVLTKRNRRSRKVKETENDDDNDDNNDKEEEDDEEIKNTNQEKVNSAKEEEKEKSIQKETPKIEVKEEVVKLENEINEELLSSQVYGKSTDEKEEEEEEENNTPQRKRRISSSGSIDNSSPVKKQKESPITKSKRKRSNESPSRDRKSVV